jgi:hypothetical protein
MLFLNGNTMQARPLFQSFDDDRFKIPNEKLWHASFCYQCYRPSNPFESVHGSDALPNICLRHGCERRETEGPEKPDRKVGPLGLKLPMQPLGSHWGQAISSAQKPRQVSPSRRRPPG